MHVSTALVMLAIAGDKINPEKLRPGWVGGSFAYGLMIIFGLLMWSFVRMAKRARQPWPDEDESARGDDRTGAVDRERDSTDGR